MGEVVRRAAELKDVGLPPSFLAEKQEIQDEVMYQVRYKGYLERERRLAAKLKDLDAWLIPTDLDYLAIKGLRNEARAKLDEARPINLGQASRMSGVNPADISLLMIYLRSKRAG